MDLASTNYILLYFMAAFVGGMATMYIAIQMDKALDVLFVFVARKCLNKDNRKA